MVHALDRHPRLSDFVTSDTTPIDAELQPILKAARRELAATAPTEERKQQVGTVKQHVAVGNPGAEIVRLATRFDTDLIIMGTHGHSGLERILGSVAASVVREAPCTVICVKAKRGRNLRDRE